MRYAIPVTVFSKKILQKDYHVVNAAVQITRRDLLFYQINTPWPDGVDKTQKLRTMCTDTVEIECNAKLHDDIWQAGLYLYEIHRHQLIKFIEAQQLANVSVSVAIDNWYKLYDMDEDVMNKDAIFRMWQRYIRERKEMPVIETVNQIRHVMKPFIPATDQQLKDRFDELVKKDLRHFFHRKNQEINRTAVRNLMMYLNRKMQGKTIKELSKMYGIHFNKVYPILHTYEKWANRLAHPVLD